jgi:hypothetical protein
VEKDHFKKQYYKRGQWLDTKKHEIKWKRAPYWLLAITSLEYPRDAAPIRAGLKIMAHRLHELGNDLFYSQTIKELLEDGEDAAFRAEWKRITMLIVQYAINSIPIPEEIAGFREAMNSFFMYFADKFYDLLFSIQI